MSRTINLFRRFKEYSGGRASSDNSRLKNAFANAIVDSTSDAVISFDVAGRIVQWNRGAENLFGYTFEEAVGRDADLLVAPLKYIPVGQGRRGVFDATIEGRPFQGDSLRVAKDGTIIDVNITSSRIVEANGKILGVSAIMRDIRDRKNTEFVLIACKQRFQNLFDYASAGIVITRIDGTIEQVNPAFCDMLDRTAAELIGSSFTELLPHEHRSTSAEFRRRLEQNPMAKFEMECPIIHRNGTCRWCQRIVSTIPSPLGGAPFVISFLIDVTDKRAAAEALIASEARFRGLFEHSPAGIVIRDEHGFIEQCNHAFCDLVGYPKDELLGTNISRLLPSECQVIAQRNSDALTSGFAGNLSNDGPLLHKDGRKVWVHRAVSTLPQPEGSPLKIVSFHIDVTESRLISEQLQESERRLRSAMEATGGGVWDWDMFSGMPWWSDNMYGLWGVPKDTTVTADNLMAMIHEKDRERVRIAVSDAIANQTQYNCEYRINSPMRGVRWVASIGRLAPRLNGHGDHFVGMSFDITDLKRVEQVIIDNVTMTTQLARIADAAPGVIFTFKKRPDGSTYFPYASEKMLAVFGIDPSTVRETAEPLLARIHPDDQQSVNERMAISAQSLSIWQHVYRYEHPTKGPIWVETFSSPLSQNDDSITWHGVAHDVTTRLNYEAAINSLRRVNAIAAVAGGVAHDLNNILTVISGNLYLLQNEVTGSKGKEWLASAMNAATSGASINQRLLRMSGKQSRQTTIVDLNIRMPEIVQFLQRILGENIQINTQFGASSMLCRVDSGELDSAILNLAVNARDAMNGIGSIVIATGAVHINVDVAQALGGDVHSGDFVRLALTDTGCGMAPEILKQIGDPFFTTKEYGKGAGLGLFSVKAFAGNFGGFVTIDSQPLKGTTVSIYFPSISVEAAKNADLRLESREGMDLLPQNSSISSSESVT